jgi:hypothetical protein
MKKIILTLLVSALLATTSTAWEEGQPGDYSYSDYSYSDYSYDVTPPNPSDYNYESQDSSYDYSNHYEDIPINIDEDYGTIKD